MPVLAPVIGAAVAFLASPMGLAIVGGIALAVVGGLLLKPSTDPNETARAGGVETEFKIGEDVAIGAVFGRGHVAGHYAYHHTYGSSNRYLQMVYILGNGVHDSLEHVFVEGERHNLTGANTDTNGHGVSGDYADRMWVKFYNGELNQVADDQLVANSGGRWTSDHRLAGMCYVIVTFLYDEDVYGNAIPKLGFQLKGLRLYDWRLDDTRAGGSGDHRWDDQSTWEWTDNVAVCMYNYRRGLYQNDVLVLGQGATDFDCDMVRFTAAANLCDEEVTYVDTSETMARYTIDAFITDDTDYQTVIRMFEVAMGGYGTEIGGAYGPLPAQTHTSVATIQDSDIIITEPVMAQKKMPPSDTYTAVQGVFADPEKSWQEVTYGICYDTDVDAAEGGRRLAVLDLPFITKIERAQGLAEILRRRDLYQAMETLTVGTKFAALEPGDVITRTKGLFGTINMMVLSREEMEGKVSRLILREWNNAIVPVTSSSFLELPPATGSVFPPPSRIHTVDGLALEAITLASIGTDTRAGIRVTWDIITDPTVSRVLIKYWPDTETEDEAQTVIVDQRLSAHSTVLTGLVPETLYHVKATIVTEPSRATVWSDEETVTTNAEIYTATTSVADLAITLNKLSLELQNLTGLLSSEEPGAVFTMIQDVRDEIERQANAAYTLNATYGRETSLLSRQVEGAAAAVVVEKEARVAQGEAFAAALIEVTAGVDDAIANGLADGLFKLEASVDGGGSEATISAKVRVTSELDYSSAAWVLQATADGEGGTTAVFGVYADSFFVASPSGDMAQAMTYDGTTLTILAAAIDVITSGRIESADGKSFWDLNSGDFRIST